VGRNIAFQDLLFNLCLGFVFLFLLSYLLIKPIIKKADAKNKAELVIVVTWPDNNPDDIDVWLSSPAGLVWFRDKEQGMAHLDRDDMGSVHDMITLADGRVVNNPRNQEIVSIRGYVPGEWILNVHMYKKRVEDPTPVKVSIDRVNPSFKTLFIKEIVLEQQWQEETATRFTMLGNGSIVDWDDLPKQLVLAESIYEEGGR
jgi:hypothetical protein